MPSTATDRLAGLTTSVAVKAPCKVAATGASLTLSGEQTISSVAVVSGDRVLRAPTSAHVDAGIWVVSTGAWSRAKDWDGARDVVQGTLVPVLNGDIQFYEVSTSGDISPGTTSVLLEPSLLGASIADAGVVVERTESTALTETLHFYIQSSPIHLSSFCALDGVTDDSTQLASVFTEIAGYGGGRVVMNKAGTLLLGTKMTIPENLTIEGWGKEVSKIKVNGAFVGFERVYATHTDVNRLNLVMRNLQITGAATALGGVKLDLADYFDFEHVQFEDFQATGAYGALLTNCYRGGFRFSHFENIDTYGVAMQTDGVGVGCNHTWIENNEFIGNNQAAFVGILARGQNVLIKKNDISGNGNGLSGIVAEGTDGLRIVENYIEQWLGPAIDLTSGTANTRVRVVGGNIHSQNAVICDFDHASVNSDVRVDDVRFSDATGGQTCINFGTTTSWGGSDIDPASGIESDKGPLGKKVSALRYSATWDPANLASGASTSTEVAVATASVDDNVLATLDTIGAQDMMVTAHVRASGVVRVVLLNREAGAVDLGSSNLYLTVLRTPQ